MRKFEKISFKQFKKDVGNDKELYNCIELPKRSTNTSAGYDIKSITSGVIKPGESMVFKTGLKVQMNDDEVLFLIDRSSVGFKYDVVLSNASDFYNNSDNEGHFSIKLINHGQKDYEVNIGDRIAQGIFLKYLTVNNEDKNIKIRTGGIGSTNKKEEKL